MCKIRKCIFLCLFICIVFLFLLFVIDYALVKSLKNPIFCIRTKEYWDGGSYECYGAFYKVNRYADVRGRTERIEIGGWNMRFQKES